MAEGPSSDPFAAAAAKEQEVCIAINLSNHSACQPPMALVLAPPQEARRRASSDGSTHSPHASPVRASRRAVLDPERPMPDISAFRAGPDRAPLREVRRPRCQRTPPLTSPATHRSAGRAGGSGGAEVLEYNEAEHEVRGAPGRAVGLALLTRRID